MSRKYQTGFSLVEVLVSVLVISFGLLSLANLQITSIKGVNSAHSQNIASMLTMELSERMRSNPQGVADGFYGETIRCSDNVKQCRGTQTCSAQETATFDLYEIMCGVTVDNETQGGARNLLPMGNLRVFCDGGCDQPDVVHKVTLSWNPMIFHKGQSDAADIAVLSTEVIP